MIPKNILKQYPVEDWEIIQKWQKFLKVFENNTMKEVSKKELKKKDPNAFYSGLYRATFHMTAIREINNKEYYFKNIYCFSK